MVVILAQQVAVNFCFPSMFFIGVFFIFKHVFFCFLAGFVQQTLDFLKKENYGELASIIGRYYAMDRDKRWERIQCAYEGLVGGRGDKVGKDQVVEVGERFSVTCDTELKNNSTIFLVVY